ncbi:FeoB-associated Cys-rich membrane protein [Streptococcaceae bacterium ESL0687]|nr:FeoB-associated Cys-rich membrane protein [Streptococcaceae bacterium ESL0687]
MMNISTLILLLIILSVFAYALRKIIKSKGACEDCKCSCPTKVTPMNAAKKPGK